MASPSSAKLPVGSSKLVHGSKRDATARSRIVGASSVSSASRRVNGSVANANGGGSGHSSGHATRVYMDGVDVTPQSLLLSRIKPSTPSGGSDPRGKGKGGKGSRSKVLHGQTGGASMLGASVLFSSASTSSADNDSDSESSSAAAVISTGKSGPKDVKPGVVASNTVAPASNQEDEGGRTAVVATPADPEDREDGKEEVVDSLATASSLVLSHDVSLSVGEKPSMVVARTRRAPVTVLLAETATEVLLDLRSVCVAQDAPVHAAVVARNKRYLATCAQKKGSDKYVEGRAQTLQLAQKAKEVMTAPPATRDVACVATDWDIFDCAKLEDESNAEPEELMGRESATVSNADAAQAASPPSATSTETETPNPTAAGAAAASTTASRPANGSSGAEFGDSQLKRQVDEIVGATLASPGCVLDVDGDIVEDLRARQHHASRSTRKGREKHSSGGYSQKSRALGGMDSQRSAAFPAAATSGNSTSSQALGGHSSGNVSFGASQDIVGLAPADGASSGSAASTSQVGMSMSNASRGVLSGGSGDARANNVYARANTNVDIGEIIAHQRTAHVLGSTSLLLTASIVERAVQQNVYHQQHVRYRDFPTLVAAAKSSETVHGTMGVVVPTLATNFAAGTTDSIRSDAVKGTRELEELWAFRCELTQGRTVSCLAWNTANDDLLAVSYARAEPSAAADSTAVVTSPVAVGVGSFGAAASGLNGSPAIGRAGQNSQTTAAAAATAGAGGSASEENDGLVLFWSLINPEFPERIYHLPVGVTSIDFSTAHPYLLAVGFVDGVVAIYDTRKDDAVAPGPSGSAPTGASSSLAGGATASSPPKRVPIPIATSSGSSGKHLDAVWQVRWVARGGGESVVSVSGDGRVVEWSLKKGLSFSDLMTLKRAPNPLLGGVGAAAAAASGGATGPGAAGGGGDGVISRQASGRCLAFASRGDPSVYFVGTEDGLVHKCSVSYNEQYLQTYVGHTGPVYQLLVSPFCSDLFLSCSGDWSLKLWHQGEPHGDAALTFRSVDLAQAVLGASWSPSDAAVFAAVAEDGRVEIWDLAQSILDPVVRHFPKKYVPVTAPASDSSTAAPATASGRATMPEAAVDLLAEPLEDADPEAAPTASGSGEAASTLVEVPIECTTVAFAPTAPVLVVGDSTGDVTVYRVPTQLSSTSTGSVAGDGASDVTSGLEDQVTRLLRAIYPNKHE
ncbi:hypothetical protein BBJ28_00009328 [Nothophytophthora sp. Chile5]|nr:hypothetical protein BBJ28_00009328 [Nothophytophthora sp. Chile5]